MVAWQASFTGGGSSRSGLSVEALPASSFGVLQYLAKGEDCGDHTDCVTRQVHVKHRPGDRPPSHPRGRVKVEDDEQAKEKHVTGEKSLLSYFPLIISAAPNRDALRLAMPNIMNTAERWYDAAMPLGLLEVLAGNPVALSVYQRYADSR